MIDDPLMRQVSRSSVGPVSRPDDSRDAIVSGLLTRPTDSASLPPIDADKLRAFAQWLKVNSREQHSELTDEEYFRLRKRVSKEHGIWREDVP